jgi:hypothetical protein
MHCLHLSFYGFADFLGGKPQEIVIPSLTAAIEQTVAIAQQEKMKIFLPFRDSRRQVT